MNNSRAALYVMAVIILITVCCTQKSAPVIELKHFQLNDIDSIITKSGVQLDEAISTDGNGSLRIDAAESTLVRLFEISSINIENARLIYQAKLRTEGLEGQAYLEMWCVFNGKGEFFSRSLQSPLTGTNEWTTVETPFFLEEGQNPDIVKLNLIVDGKGTVWIDDVRVLKGALN